jgi:hypothetical protein
MCSSIVLTVKGLVGLVDPGSTLGYPHTEMMSGAWPPPRSEKVRDSMATSKMTNEIEIEIEKKLNVNSKKITRKQEPSMQ